MKLKFLMCAVLAGAIGKICGMDDQILFLNRSSHECTIDFSEMNDFDVKEVIMMPEFSDLKYEVAGCSFYFYDGHEKTTEQFSLKPNEYRAFLYSYYKKNDENVKERNDRIVVRKNAVEVGAAYVSSYWRFDRDDYDVVFHVNKEQGLVLYRKNRIWSGENVIKILDFDENIRYMNPKDARYKIAVSDLSEWGLGVPKNAPDQRPIYTEPSAEICRILEGAKQVFQIDSPKDRRKIKRGLIKANQLVDPEASESDATCCNIY